MGRTAEMVLGILGGAFGIISALGAAAIFGGLFQAFGSPEMVEEVYSKSAGGLLLGILAIVGAVLVNKNNKVSAGLMLFCAIGGLFVLGLIWGLPFILLLTGGLLALRSKG
ncbi:DUF4064 domain-containing protein [Archaeoglobus sp.]